MSVMFNKREFMPSTIKLTTLVPDPRREPFLKTEITSKYIIIPLQPHISVLHIPHQWNFFKKKKKKTETITECQT